VDDARRFTARTPERFDVVIGDLLVPWRPGEAALYTRDHFVQVRRALAPGGLFCQWLPLYQMSDEQLGIVLRTFVEVFPQTTLWRGNFLADAPTLALVGHTARTPLDVAQIDARVRALAVTEGARSPFLSHPAGFWLFLVGSARADAAWLAEDPRRNSDAEPWLELLSPGARGSAGGARFTVATAGLDEGPLRSLGPAQREWTARGAALAEAGSVPGEEGQRRVHGLLQGLPIELRRALELE
jgi:spermidine synthase